MNLPYISTEAVLTVIACMSCLTLIIVIAIGIVVVSDRYKNDSNRPK